MKIINVTKCITYYVETNSDEFPDYRTDENGENWENAMGESWETVYFYGNKNHNQLPELFQQYLKTIKPAESDILCKFEEWFNDWYGRFSLRSEWFYGDCKVEDIKEREDLMDQWMLSAFMAGYNANKQNEKM
ncbi:hypothetical protein b3_0184 [Synechococcus phage B3]|nr:hypothetical protein b3_0184 [Synechococcus phage B3]QGT54798.1 hypothetical protein b23_0183 [Synechococcus phage B23]